MNDVSELGAIKAYWDYKKNDRDPSHIGMSAIGFCARRLAYQHHGVEGLQLDWRAKIIFDDGNLHHKQIREALSAGLVLIDSCFSLIREEEEVKLGALVGHIDGVLKHDNVRCQKDDHFSLLLEVKSMNERGFQELKTYGKLSKEYGAQVSAYLRATGLRQACVIAKNKNTGEMLRLYYDCDNTLLDDRLAALVEVGVSKDAEEVAREYDHDKGKLKYPCTYCPYVNVCWRHEGVIQKGTHSFELATIIVTNDKSVDKNVKETSKSNRKRRKGLA